MQRRKFIQQTSLAGFGLLCTNNLLAANHDFPVVRLPLAQRKFTSTAVEEIISDVKKNIGSKELGWLFENCFPNTLDTTVDFEIVNGKPDTYVITGDINAMWLRDSSAQVWPYLAFIKKDAKLQQLIKGVINRQTKCVLKDPYANAFFKDETEISYWAKDLTEMKPGIHERKWEIDSLCYPIRLSFQYWKLTDDASVFDADWIAAMKLIVKTFKTQQRFNDRGPYKFERITGWATDTVPLNGYGYPCKKIGLIHSMFRPSDDATIYPFLIPSNIFAAEVLDNLSDIFSGALKDFATAADCKIFSNQLVTAINEFAVVKHKTFGKIFAYEINGFGSYNLMDDANVPSLLAIPYLTKKFDYTIVQNTRRYILSNENPFFFTGKAGEGIGGPHAGLDMIWPLGIIMRGITSDNDNEIKKCLSILQKSNAGTGFMHEAFHKDDAANFTRKWFAWANTLFGEFVLKLYFEKKYLLK